MRRRARDFMVRPSRRARRPRQRDALRRRRSDATTLHQLGPVATPVARLTTKGALMLKIYGALLSPFVRKVRCVLTEKQVGYELVATNPFDKSTEFLKR